MQLSPLTAISPIDGRYRRITAPLADCFAESALIRYRVQVEVEYFIALCELPLPPLEGCCDGRQEALRRLYIDFAPAQAQQVKSIERDTNHDVKAVEYYLKARFEELGLGAAKEFIHFGLTSQDINNTALPLALKAAWSTVLAPALEQVTDRLEDMSQKWRGVPMLARTHGQPASPTRLGKELYVFVERLRHQLEQLAAVPFGAKFGGATGNFNAHAVAYPEVDWVAFSNRLVNDTLGLRRQQVTTQIEHYDDLAAFCDALRRINTILIDLDRDIWAYISAEYFRQKIAPGEVGSSTMPHKVNPIDFENSEGNLGIANALFAHLAQKLPVSRLQRDLTDSTVSRNLGVPLGHSLIGYRALVRGLDKLVINEDAMQSDLEDNWAVVAEAIQTVLRRVGYPQPYEALKAFTRTHGGITRKTLERFVADLDVSDDVRVELAAITPMTYIGLDLVPGKP